MIGEIENTITLFTVDGEKIGTINVEGVKINGNGNFTFLKKKFDLFDYYEVKYGIKMTNNYLKTHGGIMRRKRWAK